jgi:hypothetical protein
MDLRLSSAAVTFHPTAGQAADDRTAIYENKFNKLRSLALAFLLFLI